MGTSEGAKKGWTEESRRKRSESMRRKWEDLEYRAAHEAARRGAGPKKSDQIAKDAERRQGKGKWLPEKRAAFSEKMTERAKDPKVVKSLSSASQARWNRDGAKDRASEIQKKQHRNNPRRLTEEQKQQISRTLKAQWAELTPEERRHKTAAMRHAFKGGHKLTSIEATVILALNDMDAWYRVHKQIDGYTADIIVQPKLIIECDGSWHHAQRSGTDAERDERLASLGYSTLRLSEDEIINGTFAPKLRAALNLKP